MFLCLSQDACEGCEVITERLERVLYLKMVTEGTELHEIMQDCLRIARFLCNNYVFMFCIDFCCALVF